MIAQKGRLRLSGLQYAIAIMLLLPTAAEAEALLVKGMGRVLGWPVATAEGEVRFRDCGGTLHDMADGRLTRTDKRCPGGEPVAVTGTVVAVDPARALLTIATAAGERRSFLVARPAAEALAGLDVGRRVRVEGPVPGHASRLAVK